MANIFEFLMYSTVRIESLDALKRTIAIGTGFFLEKKLDQEHSKVILISNKHVLECSDSFAITFNMIENNEVIFGKVIKIPISEISKNLFAHPNPEIDVAALDCTGLFTSLFPNMLFFKMIPYEMLATFKEPELNVCANVNFIGYPDGRYDTKNNLPLIRSGIISSHPKFDFNGLPQFVIDAQVFGGSSGSPVFIDFTFENFKNNIIDITDKKIKLLGIVTQTMIKDNLLKAVTKSNCQRYATEENIGLGVVFKSTIIKELIDKMPIKL